MSISFKPSFRTDVYCESEALRHTFSNLSPTAVAIVDDGKDGLAFGTLRSTTRARAVPANLPDVPDKPGKLLRFEPARLGDRELATLEAYAQDETSDGKWMAFVGRFESGRTDRIAVRVASDVDNDSLVGFLSLIWPVLRKDCLVELAHRGTDFADEAMLWLIANKMDLAVFVFNSDGDVLRRNTAADQLLRQGHVLKRSRQGVVCGGDNQTRTFREALAACASADPDEADAVIFLSPDRADHALSAARVPVTLSRFFHNGEPTSLVTVTLPSPPDSRRVETIAREMGLTKSEARVAALIQLGLSNRAAAQMAGLTEQSLSTYAKRVLSKLNATSRAEVAQMLTWQAQGGLVT